MISLSATQIGAKNAVLDWLGRPSNQIFRLGGVAGAGKTTLMKYLLNDIATEYKIPYAVVSFTGKAVSVLRKKGILDAMTAHSYLYDVRVEKDGTLSFVKKFMFEEQLVIVDEASMVYSDLNTDLLSTKAKILYVGDPAQLEPVGDNPNLMRDCDVTLTEVHRQAKESPILRLATDVREHRGLGQKRREESECSSFEIMPKEEGLKHGDEVDQIICGYNDMRNKINSIMRVHLKFSNVPLVEGEKLICLRNNKRVGLFNGMMLWVESIRKEWGDCWVCNLKDELGTTYSGIRVNRKAILQGSWDEKKDGKVPFEHNIFAYGYCITCHKSQGSEWDSVLVMDQSQSRLWSAERWQYTAITRAAKKLIYAV